MLTRHDGLIIVDPQNDFLPGGPLAVADGMRIFEPIRRIIRGFSYVVATRDWHPDDHRYTQRYGGPWPFHCLQNTPGAEFAKELPLDEIDDIISKGIDPMIDGYSGFAATPLAEHLRDHEITHVYLCGLATDYCVKATAIDACEHGFEATVLLDAIAAVNVHPSDGERAIEAMLAAGVHLAQSIQLGIAE